MEANLTRAELIYEVTFSTLSFELPGFGTALLKAIHESFSPDFPINTDDMRVLGGNSLSDVHVQINLFDGFAMIDVRPDGISMNFRGLRNSGNFVTCMHCISLCETAARGTVPDFEVGVVAFRPTLFLDLADGTKNSSAYLAEYTGTMKQFDLVEFGNPAQHPAVSLELEGEEQGWNLIFNAYRDRMEQASLVVSIYAVYREDGAIRGLKHRAAHLQRLTRTLLHGIGIQVPDFSWEAE